MSVFDGVVRKGALGGFGLENLGNVSKLNGTVKLAESFTPVELTEQRQQPRDEEFDDEFEDDEFEDEEFEERRPEPAPQPKFFGDVNENNTNNFFGKIPVQQQKPEKIPNFFENNKQNKITRGIPKEVEFFGKIPKPKTKTPLIGNLKEGVDFFDNAFTRKGQKKPLRRATGFDNFVGTIDIERLARGKPDSAVPLRGVFAKRNVNQFSGRPVDLREMNRQADTSIFSTGEGFDNIDVNESITSFEETPETKRKAGRPKGSLGKKKRQAKKLDKKKKKSELSKARKSLLLEKARLSDGGAPRNALQARSFNEADNSFRGLFT